MSEETKPAEPEREPTIIPDVFSLKQMIEEIDSSGVARQNLLDGKISKNRIGKEEANLTRYSIARLRCVSRFLRDIRKSGVALPAWMADVEAEERAVQDAARQRVDAMRGKTQPVMTPPAFDRLAIERETLKRMIASPSDVDMPPEGWSIPEHAAIFVVLEEFRKAGRRVTLEGLRDNLVESVHPALLALFPKVDEKPVAPVQTLPPAPKDEPKQAPAAEEQPAFLDDFD